MEVTREYFDTGMTYEEFKARMTRNRERLEKNERAVRVGASDLVALKSLSRPLNVLAIAEDWCGDVVANLPILGRLAADGGSLSVRVFLRDANPDLMDLYLKEGKFRSIPVFVFLDERFEEIGRFVERPATVTELRERKRRELFAEHPEFGSPDAPIDGLPTDVRDRLVQGLTRIREETQEFANGEVIRALVAIVKEYHARLNRERKLSPPTASKPKHPVKVTITYCAACGYEPQTLDLMRALMLGLRFDLSSIEVIPGEEGAFEVAVGDHVIHSMYRDGGFGETDEIVESVRAHTVE